MTLLATPPSRAMHVALRVLQLGAIAVVLVAAPYKAFDLDRFSIAKELVLHVTATLVVLLVLGATHRARRGAPAPGSPRTIPDVALAGFLLLGVLSALFATNHWAATRALAVSLASVAIFWSARALSRAGCGREIVHATAAAAAIGAGTALLQAYGVETVYFSQNRAPGGTFGNRNFMAHVAAIGIPLLVFATLQARGALGLTAGALGTGLVSAALVLSRSRAAWLAVGAGALPLMLALLRMRRVRAVDAASGRTVHRLALGVAVTCGVAVAIVVPNTLDWRSDSPYLESARGLVNYREGSGRGRLVQYTNSLRMALAHPMFGVGPGNWPVRYPEHASRRDPSLTSDGMTANPWPSSDWVAFLSERGIPAFLVLVAAAIAIGVAGLRATWSAEDAGRLRAGVTLVGTLGAALTVGLFDASLLLPIPALLVWAALGALLPMAGADQYFTVGTQAARLQRPGRVALAVAAVGALAILRSGAQLAAMATYGTGARLARVERAALLDPGNFRIRMRLAEARLRAEGCRSGGRAARAPAGLFPNAPAARRLAARCRAR